MTSPLGPQFRAPRGAADADAVLALLQACNEQDGFDPLSASESAPTAGALASFLAAADPRRVLLLEFNGQLLGYGRIADWPEEDGTRVWLHRGWVRPEWRGSGLGTTLLCQLEQRIETLAAAAGGRWEYAANANSMEPEATRLLREHGYTVGYTVLELGLDWAAFEASLERTTWPSGFATRPVTAGDVPAIVAAIDDAYHGEYQADRFRPVIDWAAYTQELLAPPYDLGLMQVAWQGDEVAGQVIGLIERGRGELREVSVRPAYRRRGLARALCTRAVLELRARGMEVVRVSTLAEFPTRARDLYESLGFRVLKQFPRYRKPCAVPVAP